MKLRDIAIKYRINANAFSDFLIRNRLKYTKGLLTGIAVADADVDKYVALFKDELKREEEAERERRAAAEARRKADEERARQQAKEAAEKKAVEEELRIKRILAAQEDFIEEEKKEEIERSRLTESERREAIMANSTRLCREKLVGTWNMAGASYANNDILGLWVRGFHYSGKDGESQVGSSSGINNQFQFRVMVTGDETGKCYLYVSGNPNGFCATLGEIAFTEDNNYFTLNCKDSSFMFVRKS